MLRGGTLRQTHSFTVDSATAPYVVRLEVPAGSTATNMSQARHFDSISSTVLWGPFLQTGEQELRFDLISENNASVTQSAEVVSTSSSTTGPEPVAGSVFRPMLPGLARAHPWA